MKKYILIIVMLMFKQMNDIILLFYRPMDLHVPVNFHQTINKTRLLELKKS